MSDDVFQGNGGDPGAVAKVLRYHVTPREIHADDFLSNEDLDTIHSDKKIYMQKHYSVHVGVCFFRCKSK